jgi:hypothetical protein
LDIQGVPSHDSQDPDTDTHEPNHEMTFTKIVDIDDRSTPPETQWQPISARITMSSNAITSTPSNTTLTPFTSTQIKPTSNLTLCQTKGQYEINKFHQVFGHVNAKYLQSTASYYGW